MMWNKYFNTAHQMGLFLMVSITWLSSCVESDQPTLLPKPHIDSIETEFHTGFASFPCISIPTDSLSKALLFVIPDHIATLDYLRFSCKQRLDLISVDPKAQLIPLQIRNSWKYSYSQFPLQPRSFEVAKRFNTIFLSAFLPDSLIDTMTIPLKGGIFVNTTLDKSQGESIDQYLGVRKWFISTAQYQTGNDICVYSSDPRGIVIGLLDKDALRRNRQSNRDTVSYYDFISNDPHMYDSCGNRTQWNSPRKIITSTGDYLCQVYVRPFYDDTLYFARGVGIIRSARQGSSGVLQLSEYRIH